MMRTTSGGGIEMVTRFTRGCLVSTGVALAGLFAPAVSGAATGTISGNPLAITADDSGHLQVHVSGSTFGEFASSADLSTAPGLCIEPQVGAAFGPCAALTPEVPPALSGGGRTLTTKYTSANPDVEVTQTFTYVDGESSFLASYAIKNTTLATSAPFRVLVQGDLNHAHSPQGQGFTVPATPAPPTTPATEVGAFNDTEGTFGALIVAGTPWGHYEEASDATFAADAASSAGLTDSVVPSLANDWVGAQFDSAGLAAGGTTTVGANWRFVHFAGLVLSPVTKTLGTGQTATITASSLRAGLPLVGQPLRYTVTGANPGEGVSTIAADGSATISLSGVNAGADTVTAYVDANGNGVYDSGSETQCVVQVIWTGGPATAPAPGSGAPGQSGTTPPASTPPAAPTSAQLSASLLKALTATGTAAKLGPLLKRHNYRFTYHALGAGRLTVSWYHVPKGGHLAKRTRPAPLLVATTTTTFTKAGNAKVTIKLTAAGAKFLRRLQHVKLTGRAVFTPTGKPPVTVIKSFTLTR